MSTLQVQLPNERVGTTRKAKVFQCLFCCGSAVRNDGRSCVVCAGTGRATAMPTSNSMMVEWSQAILWLREHPTSSKIQSLQSALRNGSNIEELQTAHFTKCQYGLEGSRPVNSLNAVPIRRIY